MNSPLLSLMFVSALWLTMVFFCCGGGLNEPSKPALTPAQRAEAEATRKKACDTMNRLKNAGGFSKIEPGYSGVTHAYVDRGFFEIPVDAKKQAVQWVALCFVDLDKKDQLGIVIIHDGYSGKQIGSFSFASGLSMD